MLHSTFIFSTQDSNITFTIAEESNTICICWYLLKIAYHFDMLFEILSIEDNKITFYNLQLLYFAEDSNITFTAI